MILIRLFKYWQSNKTFSKQLWLQLKKFQESNIFQSQSIYFLQNLFSSFVRSFFRSNLYTEKTADSPVISSKPSTAFSCVKHPEHNARNFKQILQSTTENPPGCTKQQTSVFPDYEHLYQEFCTIFLWDHIHERTNIMLDNSSGAQSFLSLETIPSIQNLNLPIFDPATSIKPNIAASQRNSKSSVIFQSPIYLTRKFDKPLQPKTIIPPGFDNSSRAQTLVNFSWAIKGIQFVTKRFSAFPISHGSTKTSLQNIKQTLDETTSDSYVLDSPDKNSSPYFLKFQTILQAFWRDRKTFRSTEPFWNIDTG